jgi:two-component system NtrC family sensor kinase
VKVLIAEDDVVLQRLLKDSLTKWGHEVTSAKNGEEAWELFEAETYPLLLTDWMMPKMDGLELVRRVRASERSGYIYIIMLTAKTQKADLIEGMEAGADDFISKPFERDELRVRLRAGERIIQLQEKLIQNEKLAGLGQMSAGLASEMDEPITYLTNNMTTLRRDVMGFMRLLNKYREGSEAVAKIMPAFAAEMADIEKELNVEYFQHQLPRQFKTSLDELQRIREVLNKLRDFAQMNETETKKVDLNAALESIIEVAHYEIKKKNVKLETEFGPIPLIACRLGKINQVFLNLMVNALQACDPEDTIRIRTRTESAGSGEEVVVEFEDTGSGIPAENLPRLFDPFFTTKSGQASGLGLSVTYGIVRDHGGTIEAESEEERGSLFRVRLPIRNEDVAGEPNSAGEPSVVFDPSA